MNHAACGQLETQFGNESMVIVSRKKFMTPAPLQIQGGIMTNDLGLARSRSHRITSSGITKIAFDEFVAG
jgi:hypothetical protein